LFVFLATTVQWLIYEFIFIVDSGYLDNQCYLELFGQWTTLGLHAMRTTLLSGSIRFDVVVNERSVFAVHAGQPFYMYTGFTNAIVWGVCRTVSIRQRGGLRDSERHE
jgi:hypothetical protein